MWMKEDKVKEFGKLVSYKRPDPFKKGVYTVGLGYLYKGEVWKSLGNGYCKKIKVDKWEEGNRLYMDVLRKKQK